MLSLETLFVCSVKENLSECLREKIISAKLVLRIFSNFSILSPDPHEFISLTFNNQETWRNTDVNRTMQRLLFVSYMLAL